MGDGWLWQVEGEQRSRWEDIIGDTMVRRLYNLGLYDNWCSHFPSMTGFISHRAPKASWTLVTFRAALEDVCYSVRVCVWRWLSDYVEIDTIFIFMIHNRSTGWYTDSDVRKDFSLLAKREENYFDHFHDFIKVIEWNHIYKILFCFLKTLFYNKNISVQVTNFKSRADQYRPAETKHFTRLSLIPKLIYFILFFIL